MGRQYALSKFVLHAVELYSKCEKGFWSGPIGKKLRDEYFGT